MGNLRLAWKARSRDTLIRLTAEPDRWVEPQPESQQFTLTNINQRMGGKGFNQSWGVRVPANSRAGNTAAAQRLPVRAGEHLYARVQVNYQRQVNGGPTQPGSSNTGGLDGLQAPNRLLMNSPALIIPPQGQQAVGEVVLPPQPARVNLAALVQLLGQMGSLSRHRTAAASLTTTLPAPQAEAIFLELNIYNNNGTRVSQRRVQVSEAAALRWEELGIQLMAEQSGFAEVLIINEGANTSTNTSPPEVYADNLSLQITSAQQVAIVQESHYLPFGLAAVGLDWNADGHKEHRYNDPTGQFPIPSLDKLVNKFQQYAINKISQTAVSITASTVNYVKDEAKYAWENTEIAFYGKADAKLTVGLGGAAAVKGLGIDARHRHVELLSAGIELDSKKGGNINSNFFNKNRERKELSTRSAVFIAEMGYSEGTIKKKNNIIAVKSELDIGVAYDAIPTPVGVLPFGSGLKLSKETETNGNTYEARMELLRTGAKIRHTFYRFF